MERPRESLLKLKKWRFFRLGGYRYSEVDEAELRLFLAASRPKCDLCGKRLTYDDIGYIRVSRKVELALCSECLRDYVEYIKARRR